MKKKSLSLTFLLLLLVVLFGSNACADPPSGAVVISANTDWLEGGYTLGSLRVENGVVLTIGGGSSVTVTGAVTVTGNASIVMQGKNTSGQENGQWAGVGVKLTAGSIQVDNGSKISADGQGYSGTGCNASAYGPGGGPLNCNNSGNGGSHGGQGAGPNQSAMTLYGSATAPEDLGSGGSGGYAVGPGAAGGGAIRLIVSGTLTNNGTISANGAAAPSYSGGGSGGSVYVTTVVITGAGSITANGGANPVGGGGGRVAVYYVTNNGFNPASITANPGPSASPGSMLFINSTTNNLTLAGGRLIVPEDGQLNFSAISLLNGATLIMGGGSTLQATDLSVTGNSTIVVQSKNSTSQIDGQWQGIGGTINAATVQIESGASISADGQGYSGTNCSSAGYGPGGGPLNCNNNGNGGSYGGLGGGPNQSVMSIFGAATAPIDLGSGGSGGYWAGSGGAGGGAIRMIVSGTLTNDGIISANGVPGPTNPGSGSSGSGSGGSVYVTTKNITGSGSITANGGTGTIGGGGGRVAVYYAAISSFNPVSITASGAGFGAQPGSVLIVHSVTNNLTLPGGQLVLSQDASLAFNNVSMLNDVSLVLGGGSTFTVAGTLSMTGKSTITMLSKNGAARVVDKWLGQGATVIARNMTIDSGSRITADGQGYAGTNCSSAGYGPGGGPLNCNNAGNGGSYGGRGGGPNQASMTVYGSAAAPEELGSGGSGGYAVGAGGAGGGAIRLIVQGTFTHNGVISANGNNAPAYSGGGSGGSVYITAGTISGSGLVTALGGASSNAGGGGRIALYYVTNNGFNLAAPNASGGSGDSAGQPGTVTVSTVPQFRWLKPSGAVLHDVEHLEWQADAVDLLTTTVTLVASGPVTATIRSAMSAAAGMEWDTRQVPDGRYELRLVFSNGQGATQNEIQRSFVVNNLVTWHTGTVSNTQTWGADKIHGIDGYLFIPSGVTVTIEPGSVIKAVPGARIIIQSGGSFNALGTDLKKIIFTTFDDDSVGGDSNLDGGKTRPEPGEWLGVDVLGNGQFNTNSATELRYLRSVVGGLLSGTQLWLGTYVYQITDNITVPGGGALTIQPGAIVKFAANTGITVQAGGRLIANGTTAQPIYFTSIRDDSVGGDTNGDGNATAPAAGDWQWLYLDSAQATFNHVVISYGGGNSYGSWSQTGVIRTTGSSTVTVANSSIRQAFYDGILAWGGTVTVSNTVLTGMDRAICAHPGSPVTVSNCTLDNNRIGLLIHGGTMDVANTIVADSTGAGVQYDFGTLASLRYSDVWTSVSGAANFSNTADPTGANGNISVSPLFRNRAQGDYRLDYRSPAINAADGTVAPTTDFMGAPRYTDPRSSPTGIRAANGAYPDMGAFEFVETATSDLDLVVSQVTGPASALVGSQAKVSWTITNIGSGYAIGPWHDAIYLVRNPDTNPVEILAGEVLVGQGLTLGPGQSFTATADIRVPGSIMGTHRWEVKANTRGEIFEGQNAGNNVALSVEMITLDLPELIPGAPALSNSFTSAGQSWWYKIAAGTNRGVGVNLALGSPGVVQLFIGQGYVPDPQHFDFQQQEWNSVTASAVIPSMTSQIYYVTVYSQALTTSNAAFTIGATSLPLSLSAVQPTSVSNAGPVTIEFIGANLRSTATYQLVGPDTAIHDATSVFSADELHAYAGFSLTGWTAGNYTARVTDYEHTVTLGNALTVTAASGGSPGGGQLEFNLEVPAAVRAGFGGTVTVNYRNTGNTDAVAPLMWLTASGANIAQTPPPCAGCSASFATIYQTLFSSGDLLGIDFQGPAGVLPPGAHGSIDFDFAPTIASGNITFTVNTITDPDAAIDWNSLKDSLRPSSVPTDAWEPIYANFTAAAGATLGEYNAVLARDATYLSRLGRYEYRVSQLYSFDLEKAGLSTITARYLLGPFGRGGSNPFGIWIETGSGAPAIHYPNSNLRAFVPDPDHPGSYLGALGDYAILAYDVATQNWTLTEQDGVVLHFIPDPGNVAGRYALDHSHDLKGNGITLSYTNGLVSSVVESPRGDITAFTYNAQGRITQATDPVGRITTYGYDSAGEHLLSVTTVGGTVRFTYVTGQGAAKEHAVQSVTFINGTHLYFDYDANGRLIRRYNDGDAQAVTYSYDASGMVTVTDGVGNASRMFSDEYGRLRLFTNPLGADTRLSYDLEHKLVGVMKPEGTFSSISYDTHGNPAGVRDGLGNQQSLSYGPYGSLQALTDSLGNTMGYGYDSRYNLTGITYPDGSNEQTSYDARGNPVKWTNRRGRSITFTYDAKNLLTAKSYADGSSVSYTYDSHRNLVSATGASGTISVTYDTADRLTGIFYPKGRSIQYAYDGSGRRTRMADQSGYAVNYVYDSVGRLSRITDDGGARIAEYTYDAAGRLVRKGMGNGTYTTFVYDAAANLLHLVNHASDDSVISRFDYTYDALGRRVGMTTAAGAWTFGYDSEGQITSVTLPGGSIAYTYDAAGNRITTNASGAAIDYNVNNLNQYTAAGVTVYRYDADGNLVTGGGSTYTYDDENRLITMANSSDTWVYEYDLLGNRVAQTHNGVRTEYVIDPTGAGNVLAEFDGKGNLLARYTYGLDLVSTIPAVGTTAYYHFDGSGNTAQITAASGSVLNSYSYLPFGEKQTSTEAIPNPFTYVGQYGVRDEGNGLYFMRYRWYSPLLGRFTQPDPAGLDGGDVNLYRYVSNSALDFVDPLGLKESAPDWGQTAINWIVNGGTWIWNHLPGVTQHNNLVNLHNTVSQNNAQQSQFYDQCASPTGQVPENSPGANTVGGYNQQNYTSAAYTIASEAPGSATSGIGATAGAPGTFTGLGATNSGINGAMNYAWGAKPPGTGAKKCTPPPPPHPQPCVKKKSPQGSSLMAQAAGGTGTGSVCGGGAGGSSSVLSSHDPNGKITVGFSDQGFIPPGLAVSYTIFFENQSAATAPALKVVVTDALDAHLDWSTVQLSQIGFNNAVVNVPPGLQSYSALTSVTTDTNPVRVTAALNPGTGMITWTMQSEDPVTGSLPRDPLAGFLPPNDATHRGEGFITFSVMPKSGSANGMVIRNQASIVFDVNSPISTNSVTNTIDTISPYSSVTALPATTVTPSFAVSWAGSDQSGSGIASYDVFVSTDGGLFVRWLTAVSETSSTFTGAAGHTYAFYSVATDNVGHRQSAPTMAQTSTRVSKGDVNSDGTINVFDALLTLQYAVGLIEHTPESNARYLAIADVAPLDATGKPKGDGQVNVFDALAILRHAVELDPW